jgi:hypothetical protein
VTSDPPLRAYEDAEEEWLIDGYVRALADFRAATNNRDDPNFRRETFLSLFSALDFAASLIERIEPPQKGKTRISVMQGVRYVRNCVHHRWTIALRGRDLPQARIMRARGSSGVYGPPVVFDWFWKPLDTLPKPLRGEDRSGRESYQTLLEEKPARLALDEIERALEARGDTV